MNTNQVMSMLGGAQVSRKSSPVQSKGRADYGGKSDSFDNALTKSRGDSLTLQDVKDLAKSAETAERQRHTPTV